jgi:hypothetical protein
LSDKETIGSEALDRCHSAAKSIGQRTNHRDTGEVTLEFEGNREDQAGLKAELPGFEEIGKGQTGCGIRKRCHGSLHAVTRKINPFQKMSDLVSTDAQGDLKYFRVRHFLAHGCIKTRAALLNVSKVKGRDIRDRLNMIVAGKVGIGYAIEIVVVARYSIDILECERLREGSTLVRIGGCAVANVPTGVDGELHEVRETQLARGSRSRAARQCFELSKVDRVGSSGLEIRIQEGSVTLLIQRVTRNILRAIWIEV